MGDTTQRKQDLGTIKIPRTAADDPDDITDPDYEYESGEFDPGGMHGFEMHRHRKDHLGMTWLEYLNGERPAVAGGGDVDLDSGDVAEQVAERVAAAADGDAEELDVEDTVEKALDDLVDDVRSASYQGAREALEEARL